MGRVVVWKLSLILFFSLSVGCTIVAGAGGNHPQPASAPLPSGDPAPGPNPIHEQTLEQLQNIIKPIKLKNTLKFGEACLIANEQKRAMFTKQFLNLTAGMFNSNVTSTAGKEMVEKFIAQLKTYVDEFLKGLNNTMNLCDGDKYLQCAGNSNATAHGGASGNGKCGCASGEAIGLKNMKLVRAGDACKIMKGSICIPEMPLLKASPWIEGKSRTPLTCEGGPSACTIKTSPKKPCNEKNFNEELKKKNPDSDGHGKMAISGSSWEFVAKQIQDGICVCSGCTSEFIMNSTGIVFYVLLTTFLFTFKY